MVFGGIGNDSDSAGFFEKVSVLALMYTGLPYIVLLLLLFRNSVSSSAKSFRRHVMLSPLSLLLLMGLVTPIAITILPGLFPLSSSDSAYLAGWVIVASSSPIVLASGYTYLALVALIKVVMNSLHLIESPLD